MSVSENFRNRIEIIRFLVEHGADINIKDNKGRTPLMLAQSSRIKNLLTR